MEWWVQPGRVYGHGPGSETREGWLEVQMNIARWMMIGALVARSAAAAAQAPGLPVMNGGVARGFTLAAMAGFPNAGSGGGTAFGVSGLLGMRRVAIGGFVSEQSGSTLDDATFFAGGGSLVIKLAGGPLVPVSINLLAGAAYSSPKLGLTGSGSYGAKTWHVPVGLGISWTIAQPVVAIKPWLSPRLDYTRVRISAPSGGVSRSDSNFGLSGGITFGFLNGFGIDLAVDRVFDGSAVSKPSTVGLGVSYTIK